MVVCTIPFTYIHHFEDLVAGLLYDCKDLNRDERRKLNQPVWLLVEDSKYEYHHLDPHFVLSSDPKILAKEFKYNTIGIWDGTKQKKWAFLVVGTAIALDRVCRNKLKVKEKGTHIYYGFKNLDELKIHPPSTIITSTPLRAALSGILLSDRERRPKSMSELTPWTHMTKAQIELARQNIRLIKEAAGWK